MKRLKLVKKTKRIQLKKKNVSRETNDFFEILYKQIKLSEEKNKRLPEIDKNKIYHYKDRLPPNDATIMLEAFSPKYSKLCLPAPAMLQHYIAMQHHFKFDPLHPEWKIIVNNKPKLKRRIK
jgi:hypothetical protein